MVKENTQKDMWSKYNAWAMMGAALLFVMYDSSKAFLAIALTSFLIDIVMNRKAWERFGWWGGLANVITTLRLLMISWIVYQHTDFHNYVIFVLGILSLIADGLDGYYARKYHTVSSFGDNFDKETDAFFVLAFGVVISQRGLAAEWVLVPGLLRYLYVIILSLVEMKVEVPAASFRRQFIGMWLMGTLMACFVVPPVIYIPGLVLAIMLILFSFGKDLYGMLTHSGEKVTQG